LTSDTKSVPITNITVEELSYYFIQRLIENKNQLQQHAICAIEIKVFSAPGQSASSRWENNHD